MRIIIYIFLLTILVSFSTIITVYRPIFYSISTTDTLNVVKFNEVKLKDSPIGIKLDSIFNEIDNNPWQLYKFRAKEWNDTIWWEIADFGDLEFMVEEFNCQNVLIHNGSKIYIFAEDKLLNKLFVSTSNTIVYYIEPKKYYIALTSLVRILSGYIADTNLEVVTDIYAGKGFFYKHTFPIINNGYFTEIMNRILKIHEYINNQTPAI
ncbi:MAG: hypothetical protein HDS75_02020 [Bacteroidales bacterium]|nr:hypothetical protein [Bacteroidales bacterium]